MAKTNTSGLREALTQAGSEHPPSEDDISGGVTLSAPQRATLVESFRLIGQANLDLIDEVQAVIKKMNQTAAMLRRMEVAAALAVVLAIGVFTALLCRLDEVSEHVDRSYMQLSSVSREARLTLGVVRANSEAVALKLKADMEVIGPSAMSPADSDAKDAAFDAAKKAADVEKSINPNALPVPATLSEKQDNE